MLVLMKTNIRMSKTYHLCFSYEFTQLIQTRAIYYLDKMYKLHCGVK